MGDTQSDITVQLGMYCVHSHNLLGKDMAAGFKKSWDLAHIFLALLKNFGQAQSKNDKNVSGLV